jgi:hypothetical protein
MDVQVCHVTQAELQQDMQRFAGVFSERVEQAAETMAGASHPRHAAEVLQRALVYESSAIEIATGQLPEANLLDMVVFVSLARGAFESHWLPKVFGPAGSDMLQALERSETDAWEVAARVLSREQLEQLKILIQAWQLENAGQVHVEAVRLADFSKLHGEAARKANVTGLLSGVRTAARAADEAMRLGERAMFLAQRAPFALRTHVRVGALEVAADTLQFLDATWMRVTHQVDRMVRGWLLGLALVGAVWLVIFWLGYAWAR